MKIANNLERYIIQELDSIGVKYTNKDELEDKVVLYFSHRGIEVKFNVITTGDEIKRIDSVIIGDDNSKLEYDSGNTTDYQFYDSFEVFVKYLNTEIMKLDGIGNKDDKTGTC